MSRESTLLAGKQAAEEAFVDTVVFKRLTGHTFSETTGKDEPTYLTLFTSPCKLKVGAVRSLVPAASEVGNEAGREITSLRSFIHIPVSAPPVQANDIATMTGVGSYTDPQILGRVYKVIAPIRHTHGTARRFAIEEVLS